MTGAQTAVRKVRVHGSGGDAGLARLRLESLLSGAELRPSGLPPSAVLCVRRVADPLPGALRLDTVDARPPPEWERAFVARLERALRGAARPAREAVPAAADAVLFADRSELLACLARDARDGTMWTRWWWRDLDPGLTARADPVVDAWLETPEHVPAALEVLAARGEAVRVVGALPPAAAVRIVERVVEAFGLVELAAVVAVATTSHAPKLHAAVAPAPDRAPPTPPWRPSVPEAASQPLAPARELLLGVALAVRRTPTAVRTHAFAKAAREWLEIEAAVAPAHATPPETIRVTQVEPATRTADETPHDQRAHAAVGDAPVAVAPVAPATRTDRPVHPLPEPGPETPSPPFVASPQVDSDVAPAPPPAPDAHPSAEEPRRERAQERAARSRRRAEAPPRRRRRDDTHRRTPAPPTPVSADVAPAPAPEPEPAPTSLPVETALGGVFYLLNLALYLELYGDFTQPRRPGIALDPWDFLALVAPRLLDEPQRGDALWSLLARLAARAPRDRPGAGFRPPRAWRTPRTWLAPFDAEGDWRWSAAGGALRIVHPAGFTVAAVPRTDDSPYAQLERELRRLGRRRPAPRRCTLPREPSEPVARWAARFAAYADARLRLALDLAPADSLGALLLHRHARVLVSPTHVDVVLRLDELPLEVRFAGLDRTPGWIPAAGRFVALHFE